MPITQKRFLAIMEAAEAILANGAALRAAIIAEAQSGRPVRESFETVVRIAHASQPPMEHIAALAGELGHFKRTRRKNERDAERLRRQRGQGDFSVLDPNGGDDDSPLMLPANDPTVRAFEAEVDRVLRGISDTAFESPRVPEPIVSPKVPDDSSQ